VPIEVQAAVNLPGTSSVEIGVKNPTRKWKEFADSQNNPVGPQKAVAHSSALSKCAAKDLRKKMIHEAPTE
jgi:hypothetical protein